MSVYSDSLIIQGWFDEDLIVFSSNSKTATLAVTLDDISTSFSATLGHSATLSVTLADVTVASSATLGHSLAMAVTLDSIVPAFSATVTSGASLTATLAVTLADVTAASSATVGHSATLSATLADISFTSTATDGHPASLAVTLADVVPAFSATVTHAGSITGTMAVTLDDISFAATANVQQRYFVDTHDGEYHKKKFKKEIADKERRKAQIIDLYEELVELKPKAAADVVAPFIDNVVQANTKGIDFYSMLQSLDRAEALYESLQRELNEIDDEDVLLLL